MRNLSFTDNKLKVIEQLIILNDDKVFEQIEQIINESLHRPKAKYFSKQELVNRVHLSNKDIEENNIFSQEEVEKLTQSW